MNAPSGGLNFAPQPIRAVGACLACAGSLLLIAGCAKNARTHPDGASASQDTAAKAPLASSRSSKAGRGDRPESPPDSAETGATGFDAAATDLQSLFEELKNTSGAEKSGPEAASASAPTLNDAVQLDPAEPVLALDSVREEPVAPTPIRAPASSRRRTPGPAAETQPPDPAASAVTGDAILSDAPRIGDDSGRTPRAGALASAADPDPSSTPTPIRSVPETPRPPAFRIGTVALCQRVESFGRFTPLPTNKFVAGKPALLILYTELANFTEHEEAGTGGEDVLRAVELSQQLDLFFDADGSRQFGIPEQTVRDTARTARRDFFIVQRVELPRNLSVGKYNLKIAVRDRYSGAEAEKIVPISIVADPTIAAKPDAPREAIGGRPPGPSETQAARRVKR